MRRMNKAAAQALLEGWVGTILGEVDAVSPRQLARAIQEAEGKLNRSARRALGWRGDGRFHPLVRHKAIPGCRPALATRRAG